MYLEQIASEIRRLRQAKKLTQSELAARAGITRTTLNQLENGAIGELGVRKLQAVLNQLGLELTVQTVADSNARDYLNIAAKTASVSFKHALTEQELLRAILTGKIPAGRRPHIRTLLEETRPAVMSGLITQLTQWASSARLQRNLAKMAEAVGYPNSTK
ncbi:MAG: helix-turn-helix transcriptional regulator [Steroidobacteraceae bacterium]|nr:helix-turn-helix transcriptional regulator [Steroidobacteraceae bacterium]